MSCTATQDKLKFCSLLYTVGKKLSTFDYMARYRRTSSTRDQRVDLEATKNPSDRMDPLQVGQCPLSVSQNFSLLVRVHSAKLFLLEIGGVHLTLYIAQASIIKQEGMFNGIQLSREGLLPSQLK